MIVCEYYAHLECQDFAVPDCTENATYVPGKELLNVKHQVSLIKSKLFVVVVVNIHVFCFLNSIIGEKAIYHQIQNVFTARRPVGPPNV